MISDAVRQQLKELSDEYRRTLPEKFAELDLIWRALNDPPAAPARFADLQRELHTLVGTAQTLGVPAVTKAARAAEEFLDPYAAKGAIPAAAAKKFERLLEALKQSAAEA